MFWKELSLQKLLEIIPIEHLTTKISHQGTPVLNRSNQGAGGQDQS